MSMLEAGDVFKACRSIQALRTCSIGIGQGSITGLTGPNISGKATLFNMIAIKFVIALCDTMSVLDRGATITAIKLSEMRNNPAALEDYLGD